MDKVNLAEKLAAFDERWAPRIVARSNGDEVMLVKVEGALVWHGHPESDNSFEHRPVARGAAQLLLIEPAGTPNTGDPATAVEKRL